MNLRQTYDNYSEKALDMHEATACFFAGGGFFLAFLVAFSSNVRSSGLLLVQ